MRRCCSCKRYFNANPQNDETGPEAATFGVYQAFEPDQSHYLFNPRTGEAYPFCPHCKHIDLNRDLFKD